MVCREWRDVHRVQVDGYRLRLDEYWLRVGRWWLDMDRRLWESRITELSRSIELSCSIEQSCITKQSRITEQSRPDQLCHVIEGEKDVSTMRLPCDHPLVVRHPALPSKEGDGDERANVRQQEIGREWLDRQQAGLSRQRAGLDWLGRRQDGLELDRRRDGLGLDRLRQQWGGLRQHRLRQLDRLHRLGHRLGGRGMLDGLERLERQERLHLLS